MRTQTSIPILGKWCPIQVERQENVGASDRSRTYNLLITNQLPYHWATEAFIGTCYRTRTDKKLILSQLCLPIAPSKYLAPLIGFKPTPNALEEHHTFSYATEVYKWCPQSDSN